jgi:hypothetical protein
VRYRLVDYDVYNSFRDSGGLFEYIRELHSDEIPRLHSFSASLVNLNLHKKNIFIKAYCSCYDNKITLSEKEVFILRMSSFQLQFTKVCKKDYHKPSILKE